jgi:hypothetical protein
MIFLLFRAISQGKISILFWLMQFRNKIEFVLSGWQTQIFLKFIYLDSLKRF